MTTIIFFVLSCMLRFSDLILYIVEYLNNIFLLFAVVVTLKMLKIGFGRFAEITQLNEEPKRQKFRVINGGKR